MYKCKHLDCDYRISAGGLKVCDYIGITGHSRGCPADKCDKYSKGKVSRGKQHITLKEDHEWNDVYYRSW